VLTAYTPQNATNTNISTLLIALLHAGGIPTFYRYRTVDMSSPNDRTNRHTLYRNLRANSATVAFMHRRRE